MTVRGRHLPGLYFEEEVKRRGFLRQAQDTQSIEVQGQSSSFTFFRSGSRRIDFEGPFFYINLSE